MIVKQFSGRFEKKLAVRINFFSKKHSESEI